jgi:hypothetical protein
MLNYFLERMRTNHLISLFLIVCVLAPQSFAGLIGGNIILNSTGRFPDVAYGNGKYLVVWPEYSTSPSQTRGRFVTSAGAVSGAAFVISDVSFVSLYPSVSYSQATDEFLVTWDEEGRPTGDGIFGRRVSGATGLPVGSSFRISNIGVRSNSAWSSTSSVFLVVYHRASEVYGRRVDASGSLLGSELAISNDSAISLYPAVTYGSSGNQFLVTWDFEELNNADIRGRRIDAGTGNLLGSFILVTNSHHKNRSTIAYDPNNARWLVQFNELGNPGNSYDQSGQFVDVNGALDGGLFVIAGSPAFEGDTLLGADIAFAPGLGRYFSTYQFNNVMGGQEMSASATPINSAVTLSSGPGEALSMATAADPLLNRFLVVWEHFDDPARSIRAQLFEASDLIPPAPITNFTTTPASGQIVLNWTNPSNADFAGTMIRWKLGSFPAHLNDGTLLVNKTNSPGSNDSHVHMGLSSGLTYFYSAFAYDQAPNPNYSSAVNISGIPAVKGDFDVDTDVDQKDFGHFQKCFSGATVTYESGCSDADLDVDGDVDAADFTIFDGCMRGANTPPGC